MGLDMYLTKRAYVKNWTHMTEDQKHKVTIEKGGKVLKPKLEVKGIEFEAGYWRKANAIHQWFVDNVQDGEDDCKEYYVSEEDLKKLLETVNKVLEASELVDGEVQNGTTWQDGKSVPIMEKGQYIKDPKVAEELLPTQSGFFFGGTNYDQWYYQDLELTKEIIENVLADDTIDGEIYYQSSW